MITANMQLDKGIITQTILLNTNHKVKIININTPTPNTNISLLIYVIISSAIIGIPPKCILATLL